MPDAFPPGPDHDTAIQLVEVHPDAVVVVGANSQVLYVNQAAEALFGRPREELLQEPLAFAVTDAVSEVEVLGRRGQRRTAELRHAAITWYGQPAQLVAIRDISHLKSVEAELRRTVGLLEQANHRLDTFVVASAHDLRAPMEGIAQLCWMIKEDHPKLDASIRRDLQLIEGRAKRMSSLILWVAALRDSQPIEGIAQPG